MQHLSGMDASFLQLETPETPMHVGGMHTRELPEGYAGDFYEDFKQHVSERMHLSPVFTRKLALMPFELSNPVWVDDDEIDIEDHIRRIALPKPGTHQQLEKYVARLHASLLDRSRPMWEFFVIKGLEGRRVAQAHHAGIDGQAGMALAASALFAGEASAVATNAQAVPASATSPAKWTTKPAAKARVGAESNTAGKSAVEAAAKRSKPARKPSATTFH